MADVRPFRALRYDPELDLGKAISPPFDTISPDQQHTLHELSPYNAVRIELAEETGPGRYENAARALKEYMEQGWLRRDTMPAYYLYRQRFRHDDQDYTRTIVFARLRLVPWSDGVVLPHEQTFGAPKEDRIRNMRATRLNASPVFLVYRDADGRVRQILDEGALHQIPIAEFEGTDGQRHTLTRIDEPGAIEEIERAFADEVLYIADGHHRYETALAYRDEARGAAGQWTGEERPEVSTSEKEWTGEEPANFALVALAAVDDPGLLVLPIHRVTAAGDAWVDVGARLESMFNIEPVAGDADPLESAVASRMDEPALGLVASEEPQNLLLTIKDGDAVDRALPEEHAPEWRALEYSIANYAVMREGLGLSDAGMSDYNSVWFTESAEEGMEAVRNGRAKYAVILRPLQVHRMLEIADIGERMPQKSTFFYPKVPTGIVFNVLED
jgi:uncharacterized protein (DUF1015 family)